MCIMDFVATDGNTYTISVDDPELIEVRSEGGLLGSISLRYVEEDSRIRGFYYITDLSLGKFPHLGIGTACLRFHIEVHDEAICAARADGPKMDDGSHLVNAGLPFITKMRKLGLVCP